MADPKQGFNRTILELKPVIAGAAFWPIVGFNRTILELKLA